MMTVEIWSLIVTFFYIYLVTTIIYLLLDNREASSTFAWVFVLITFPVVGLFLYLMIGRNRRKSHKHMNFQQHGIKHLNTCLSDYISTQEQTLKQISNKDGFESRKKIFELLYRNSNSLLTTKNKLKLFYKGQDKFESLIADLKNAKKFIHMEYYIWRSDTLTEKIKAILIEKAKEGVEIRILYDVIGSIRIHPKYIHQLKKHGIQICSYDNLHSFISQHSLNYRNHRKIVVIDGTIAYTGGMNMGQEYIDGGQRFSSWRDTHIRIEGEAVAILQSIFTTSWNLTTQENLSGDRYLPKNHPVDSNVPLQITTSGPDSEWSSIEQLYFNLINSAQERICIQSPYFIPTQSIYKALLNAALGGIEVKIIITGKADRKLPFWAAFSFFEPLLRAGVEIHHYQSGFMHAKSIIIDSEICTVGTANMDIRSFQLNYEINVLIYDKEISADLSKQFDKDLKSCDALTLEKYEQISNLQKFRNSLARLFAPIM